MDKNRAMVQHFIKGSMFLTLNEQKRAVQQLFPEVLKDDQLKLMKLMKDLHRKLNLHEMKRHPVLLIVDEVCPIFVIMFFVFYPVLIFRNYLPF